MDNKSFVNLVTKSLPEPMLTHRELPGDNSCLFLILENENLLLLGNKGTYFIQATFGCSVRSSSEFNLLLPKHVSSSPGFWVVNDIGLLVGPDSNWKAYGKWAKATPVDYHRFGLNYLADFKTESYPQEAAIRQLVSINEELENELSEAVESLHRFVDANGSSSDLLVILNTIFIQLTRLRDDSSVPSSTKKIINKLLKTSEVKELIARLCVSNHERLKRLSWILNQELSGVVALDDEIIKQILYYLETGVEKPGSSKTLYVDLEKLGYRFLHQVYVQKFGPLNAEICSNDIDFHIRDIINSHPTKE